MRANIHHCTHGTHMLMHTWTFPDAHMHRCNTSRHEHTWSTHASAYMRTRAHHHSCCPTSLAKYKPPSMHMHKSSCPPRGQDNHICASVLLFRRIPCSRTHFLNTPHWFVLSVQLPTPAIVPVGPDWPACPNCTPAARWLAPASTRPPWAAMMLGTRSV